MLIREVSNLATFTYDWEAKVPARPQFQVLSAEDFKREFGFLTEAMDKGADPLTGKPVRKAVAKVFKWKVQLNTTDADMLKIWQGNWESSEGKADAVIYCVHSTEGAKPVDLPPSGSSFFSPDLMKYVVVNPSGYEELKTVALRVISSELAEKDGHYLPLNASCAEVLNGGVCILAPRGYGKTTHVYGLSEWTDDGSTKFHSDGWLFVDVNRKKAYSPEKKHYFSGMPSISLALKRLLSRSKSQGRGSSSEKNAHASLAASVIVRDGFLADPKELMGKDKFTKKCRLNMLIVLKKDLNDNWLIRPLSEEEALKLLESGGEGQEPYFNPFVVRDKARDERRRKLYAKFLHGLSAYAVNTRAPSWITQTLIRGLVLKEWTWAKLVDNRVYALRGDKYEPLFTIGEARKEKKASKASADLA